MRVLFTTHAPRHGYLRDFVSYAQRRRSWQLGIMSYYGWTSYFAGLEDQVEAFFPLPDSVKLVPWESDPAEVQRVTELVADCERHTGMPLNRVILAAERRMGRGYGHEFYHWPASAEMRAALRDNSMPQRLAMRLFAHIDHVLNTFRPDLIIAGHSSSPDGFVLSLLAETRGIPMVLSRPSKILSHRGFWTTDRDMLNLAGEEVCARKVTQGVSPSEAAQAHVAMFRQAPSVVAYIRRNWDYAAARTFVSNHVDAAIRGAIWARWVLAGRKGSPPKTALPRLQELYRSTYLKSRQAPMFKTFDEDELARQRYVLIALHKEPELAINFQAPLWHNQKNLIGWLSKNLPCGYRLFVRDHRKIYGRRPMSFYRDFLRYPGVDLIWPLDSQFKYIRNADLIVSDNGSTGWEGLLFGKRVVSLAPNYYEPTGLTEKVIDPSRLGEIMIRRLSEPEVPDQREWDRRLACLVESEMETTLPEDETSHEQSLAAIKSMARLSTAARAAVA